MSTKEGVLIVEDSPAIGMLLKNYLEKLGYAEIFTCTNGSSAIETFKELFTQKKHPIVLLDYMLPDMDAKSILTQILEIQPNARVVMATATEKDDEGIKELIRLGVYQYLEKPIRFENIKSIFETIEREQSFFESTPDPSNKLKQDKEDDEKKIHDQIDFILSTSKQISLNLLKQLVGSNDEIIISYLKELEDKGHIISIEDKKELACNQCDSVKINQIFYCPSCKSSNFKSGKLIEHYECGNISEESTYKNDQCPNCDKEIKALGVDFRILQNHYICNNCTEFFPEISTYYFCLKCENKFQLEDGRWKTSKNFKVVNM
ncbi:MAG: response regulator [Nitrosarchaeum sp.]